jgi:Tol biopolymer transport system component
MEANIWLAPADDFKNARQITFSSSGRMDGWYGMDFAPDGQIVYSAWIDQSLTIWIMDALGKNARQLTSTGFRDEKPTVTVDGRFIVFQSNRSGTTEIWRMDIDGSNMQQITTNGGNFSPDVTPDGSWIVYRHHDDDGMDTIWRIPSTGGEPVPITTTESFNARVSRDGKFIACIYEIDDKPLLAVLPIEGGAPLKLFEVTKSGYFSYRINWTADGRFITFPDRSSGIWQQAVEGSEARRLEGLPAEMTFSHSWSRDGKSLAFGRAREIREAVLISDFR